MSAKTKVIIHIEYDVETAECAVLAPMNQKELCYEVLRAAQASIEKHIPLVMPGSVGPERRKDDQKPMPELKVV